MLTHHLYVSSAQIERFPFRRNFRVPQPLNCREALYLSARPLDDAALQAAKTVASAHAGHTAHGSNEHAWGYMASELPPDRWPSAFAGCILHSYGILVMGY